MGMDRVVPFIPDKCLVYGTTYPCQICKVQRLYETSATVCAQPFFERTIISRAKRKACLIESLIMKRHGTALVEFVETMDVRECRIVGQATAILQNQP